MKIDTFAIRLDKLHKANPDFEYNFGEKLDSNEFEVIEKKLNLIFPEKIKEFYLFTNALKTYNPTFEIIELNELKIERSLVHFATFDNVHQICFMVQKLNKANEWTIIEMKTKYELTLTISSFWSNKIWHWLENNDKIWADKFWIND
jgi:hypothetical protein